MKRIKKALALIISAVLAAALTQPAFAQTVYNITYDYGAASASPYEVVNENPAQYDGEEVYTLLAPTCDGYEFMGWYFDAEYTSSAQTLGGEITGDITLYAKWYESSYSINYVLTDGGTGISADEIYNPNPVSRTASESVYLYDLTTQNENYVFAGWFYDEAETDPAVSIAAYTCYDVTVYAKWENAVYSVSYDLGEAAEDGYEDFNPNPAEYEYGTEVVLSDMTTENEALTFEGWYFDEDFTERADVISSGVQGNITLYANWTRQTYDITYVLADGSGIEAESVANPNPEYQDGKEDIILEDPVSDDKYYAFAGWYTSSDFSDESAITVIPAASDGEITLYAKWETAVYSITYDMGVIDTSAYPVENNNAESYNYRDCTVLTALEAEGFIFNGWSLEENSSSYITSLPEDIYGDITLYADFTEKTYTIGYVLASNGLTESEVVNGNPSVRTVTEAVKLKDPDSINIFYTFEGWFLDSSYTQPVTRILAYTTENVTVYAKWVKIVSYLPVWGDATLSDGLTAADARQALRYAAKLDELTELQLKVADVNNDGSVTAADARLILRLSASLESIDDLTEEYSLGEIVIEDGEVVIKTE
ncbi:MAG: InlB B-repeat-containing protein [Clostridiales bacterium]|nr:InlB B-repeat-containing protein [Clostridiales bacterium]